MKRTMQYIIAMAAVLWMALPQVKAQGLEEDFDPGIMYILRGEEVNINFEEGNEWEITFTALDTLGNEYYSPVGMEIKGGVYNDSTYVVMQTIDSIVMYQPEPVMQPGVFVITREYFPYITQVDGNMAIYFSKDIPLPLPVVGQKTVCNIFEEPLRCGFVGTIAEVYTEGNETVIVRDEYMAPLESYYKELLYSGVGGYTAEEDSAIAQARTMYRVRRGVPAKAPSADKQWEIKPTSNGLQLAVGWKLNEVEKKIGAVTIGLDGSLMAKADFKVNSSITDLSNAKIGLDVGCSVVGNLAGHIGIEKKDKVRIMGTATKKEDLPFNSKLNIAAGMYFDWSAASKFIVEGEFEAKMTYSLEINKFELTRSFNLGQEGDGKFAVTGELDGKAKIIFGFEGELNVGKYYNTKLNAGIIYPEITGKMKAWYAPEDYSDEITPAKLLENYKKFDEGNRVTNGIGAYYGAEAGFDTIVFKFKASDIEKPKAATRADDGMLSTEFTSFDLSSDETSLKGKLFGIEVEGKLGLDGKTWAFTAKYGELEGTVKGVRKDGYWTISRIGASNSATKYWFNYEYHFVYGLDKKKSKYTVGITEGDNRRYGIQIKGENRVLFPHKLHLWTYDHETKKWDKKDVGKIEALPKKIAEFNPAVSLRRGGTYTVMPVYGIPMIDDVDIYMSDKAIIDSMLVPYDQFLTGAKMKDFNTLTITGNIDDLMISDLKKGKKVEAGYTVLDNNGGLVYYEAFDLDNFGHTIFNIDIDATGWEPGEYKVVLSQKVGNHEEVNSDPVTFERLDMGAPILQAINHSEDISFTKGLTFRADVMEAPDADDKFGFEILKWNTETVVAEKSALGSECMKDDNTFELTYTGSDLTPSNTYEVRAFTIRNQGKKLYSQDSYEFVAPSPIFDIKALVEYEAVTLMAVVPKNVVNPSNPENIPSYVKLQFELIEKKNLIDGDWEMTDTDDILQIDAAVLGSGEVWGLSRDVTGLEDNTEYCFRVYIYITKDKILYSDTQTFKTKDTYGLKYSTDVNARKATINATCTDYAAKKDNARVRFYCSTSKSAVERGSESCIIVEDNEIESKTASVLVEGLDPETTYYYKGVLMFEEKNEQGKITTKEKPGTVAKFTTPDPYGIETNDAVVEDAMVTLKATISASAKAEMESGNYNTIYAAFDLVAKEHESDLKQGTSSNNVTRITDLTQNGTNLSVDVYLEPGTEYCYRALIYVDGKEYYGNTKSFTTLEYDGGLIPLVRKYRPDASAPWVPIIVKPEEKHLATPLKELIKE